jgi:Flp pilus assembly protein TadD
VKVAAPPVTGSPAETKPATDTVSGPPTSSAATDPKPATEVANVPPAETKPEPEAAPKTVTAGSDAVELNNSAIQRIGESRYDEAADLLQRAIQAKPDSYKLHRNLSIVYERQNKINEALTSAEAAVKLAPAEPSALTQLCSLQVQLTKFDDARMCYENLRKLTTLDVISETSYGVALMRSGRNREAIAVLQKTAAMSPANSQTLNALGVAYLDGKRPSDAISAFKNAIELDPSQHAIRFNLAIAYMTSGNKEGAVSQYKLLKQENAKLAEQLYLILFRDKVVSVDELRRH